MLDGLIWRLICKYTSFKAPNNTLINHTQIARNKKSTVSGICYIIGILFAGRETLVIWHLCHCFNLVWLSMVRHVQSSQSDKSVIPS